MATNNNESRIGHDGVATSPWAWMCFLICTLLASLAQGQELPSSFPRDDFMVPGGPVRAVVETNGIVYVGGHFDYVSPTLQTGTATDSVSGTPLPDFPKFVGAIKAILRDPNGGWFVGGQFSAAGGFPILNLARVRADMTVDAEWHPNPDGPVFALASDGERLFVGGSYSAIAGDSHLQLAALDPITGAALAWRADCANLAPGASVNALAVAESRLYVGGYFRFINGEDRLHVGSVDAATGTVTTWQPNAYSGTEAFTRVNAVAISGQTLFVGGTFLSMGGAIIAGVPRKHAAALDVTKNLRDAVLPWNPDADAPVTALAVSCDTVFLGGAFTRIGGEARRHIAEVDALNGRATAWNADANEDVLSLHLAGNVLYSGGRFTRIGGQPRDFLAALDVTSGEATLWASQADFGVTGLAVGGGSVVAGGVLGPGGQLRKNLAAFDARTGRLLDWHPQVAGSTFINGLPSEGVYALGASSNLIYVAGAFTDVNGTTRNRIAAVDAWSGDVASWNPNANNIVETLLLAGDAVYVAGPFTEVGGAVRNNLAALHLVSGGVTSWDPNPDEKVTALAIRHPNSGESQLYTGGRFIAIGGQIRKRLARFDPDNSSPSAWNPNVNDQVSAFALMGEQLYLGGQFSTVGGQARHRLAALDLDGGAPTCWNPDPRQLLDGVERTATVNVLAAGDGSILVGGRFNRLAGESRQNLAAVTTQCPATVLPWDPNVDAPVSALARDRKQVFAGGVFQSVGGQYHPFFAVFAPEGAPRVTRQPRSQLVDVGGAVVLEAEVVGNAPLVYQWQHAGTNVPGATGASLSLAAAQVEQTGDYTLVVTNALGLVNSRPARITVIQSVAIVAEPLSQTVAPGTTVVLSVVASGNPPPVYQWRLNGVNIPGAIHPSLVLSNAQAADGGSYNVVVAGIREAISSAVATLVVSSPALPFADHLADRGIISGASGVGSGSNLGKTREPGESNHAGKVGGASVWLRWVAPASGIAVFSTRGSSFDTLLGIYTNAAVGGIGRVTSDEDRGGFLTSRAAFNALGGTEYLVAVDGFAGAEGNIVLNWNLDTSTVPFPRLITEPLSQTAQRMQDATFSVVVNSLSTVSYQWFFGCLAIDGATNAMLTITNVQPANVGEYRVVVMNASSQVAESVPAVLEIGPEAKVVSRDKPEDILFPPDTSLAGSQFSAAATSDGFLSVSLGSIGAQTLNNKGATHSLGEPNHCGVLGGASRWLGLRAAGEGTLIIDTIGSTIDTVLAVYRETNNAAYLFSNLVDCNNNGAPDGIRSLVRFNTEAGRAYLVAVDGVNKAEGTIRINWKLGRPPPPSLAPPLNPVIPVGGSIVLRAGVTNGVPPPVYQWFFNQQRIAGATNVTLVLTNLQASQSGVYSVISSNFAGPPVLETNAVVTVGVPLTLSRVATAPGGFGFWVSGNTGRTVVVQATTNLLSGAPAIWTPLLTNPMIHSPVYILDTNAARHRLRYYRAVTP